MKSKKTNPKVRKRPKPSTSRRKQLMARRKQKINNNLTIQTASQQKNVKERSKLTASMKRLDASKRRNWVDLNKKQTDFLANAINSAISFVVSTIEVESAEKFEMQNTVLNAARSVLMQKVKKIQIPRTKLSVSKSNLMSKATYISLSENMDATIHSLNESINKEEKLLKEKKKLLTGL